MISTLFVFSSVLITVTIAHWVTSILGYERKDFKSMSGRYIYTSQLTAETAGTPGRITVPVKTWLFEQRFLSGSSIEPCYYRVLDVYTAVEYRNQNVSRCSVVEKRLLRSDTGTIDIGYQIS